MLDEFLEFFGRRNRRPEAKSHHPVRGLFDEFLDDDDGEGARRFRRHEDHHRNPRSERFDRRPHGEDWD